MGFSRRCGAMLAAVAMVVMSPVSVFAAGIGSRPANPNPDNPRTQSIFIYDLNRGATKSDQLIISNGLNEKADIEVYAVDGTVTATGDMTCKQRSEDKKNAGNWVKLAKNEVSLLPGESMPVDFTVNVPDKADVGEHNACLVIQRKTDPTAAKQGGIQLQTRQAVRMAITIPGNIHRDVTIDKFDVDNHSKQLYNIAIKNSGNVSADVDVKLTVKDTLGNVVYKNGGEYAAIAEEVRQFRYESNLRPFWGGKYKAEVSIAYNKKAGEWGVSKNSADLTTKKVEPIELFFWPTPAAWAIIIGAIAVAIAAVWRVIVLVKKRRKR